jgi:hypothetical protein
MHAAVGVVVVDVAVVMPTAASVGNSTPSGHR